MTDGPFRNAQLSSRWKRYGQELVSDAVGLKERVAWACDAMLGDVDMDVFTPLLKALKAHAQSPQMDLDPQPSIEAIFDSHQKSPAIDTLQKHLMANLRDQMATEQALDRALSDATKNWVATTRSRLSEECIKARDLGDMTRGDYVKGLERNNEVFAAIRPADLCDALISGNKRAFKQVIPKRAGIDDGPE